MLRPAFFTSVSIGAIAGGGPPPLSGLAAEFYDDFEAAGTIQGRTGWAWLAGAPAGAVTNLRATGGGLLSTSGGSSGEYYAYHDLQPDVGQFVEVDADLSVAISRIYTVNGADINNKVSFTLDSNAGINMVKRVAGVNTSYQPPFTSPTADVAKYRFEVLRNGELRVTRNKIRVGDYIGPNGGTFAAKNMGTLIPGGSHCGVRSPASNTAIVSKDFRCGVIPVLTDPTAIFYAVDPVTGLGPATVSGMYEGTCLGLNYECRAFSDDSVLQTRQVFTPQSLAGGLFTATAEVPRGVQRLHVQFTNDATAAYYSSQHFAAGDAFASWGQSENLALGDRNTLTHYSNNFLVNGWVTTFTAWRQDKGITNFISCGAESAKVISDLTGQPCGFVDNGVGAQNTSTLKPSGIHWPTFTARLATATGNRLKGFSWYQGPANMLNETGIGSAADWLTDTNLIIAEVRTITGNANLPVFIGGTGFPLAGTAAQNRAANRVRDEQQGLHNPAGNIYFAWHGLGISIISGADPHPNNAGNIEISRRRGLTIRKWLYGGAYDGRGPLTGTPTRSGATITIPIDLNGATSLSGTSLSGFVVGTTAASLENSTSPLTITSVNVSGSNIVIVLAADPGAPVWVASHRGRLYDESSLAIGTYADATTIPVCPMTPKQTMT